MKFVKIPKKSGGHRIICVPKKEEKAKLRKILEDSLNYKMLALCDRNIVHGFIPTRSIVTNAYQHIGYRYTLSFDLKDFFDTVTPDMVKEYLSEDELKQCFIDGRAYQGLPTSPAICNLAAIKMDAAIKEVLGKYFGSANNKTDYWIYTRYADDLVISYGKYIDWPEIYYDLKVLIPNIIAQHGFQVNLKKTRLQVAKFGNREVTGIYCSETGIKASRRVYRKIRAVKHRKLEKTQYALGLELFTACKVPCQYLPEQQMDNVYAAAKVMHHRATFINSNKPSSYSDQQIRDYEYWINFVKNYNSETIKKKAIAKATVINFLAAQIVAKETFIKISKANTQKS